MSDAQLPEVSSGESYALAFSEGVRALSEQQAVIDSFRTRSGLLLSGAAVRPELLIANYIEHPQPLSIGEIHRDLALHMDASYLRNRGQLLRLVWLFRAASILLIVEVLACVVDLVIQA